MNIFEKIGFKVPGDNADKTERYDMRKKIGELIFKLEQGLKEDLGSTSIRLGEAQSSEFIARAAEIAEDDSLWARVPDKFEQNFSLHGVAYNNEETRDDLRAELRSLIQKHS